MASWATSSSGTTGSKKRLPEELTELLDVAIYTFACQAGLRAGHKVRGNPVLEGVSAFFGQLIETANEDTKKQLKDISPGRLGGWQPVIMVITIFFYIALTYYLKWYTSTLY